MKKIYKDYKIEYNNDFERKLTNEILIMRNNKLTEISASEFINKYGKKRHRKAYANYIRKNTPKEEFTYPMYFKSVQDEDLIVKFNSLSTGNTIASSKYNTKMLDFFFGDSDFIEHTNTKHWKQVIFVDK